MKEGVCVCVQESTKKLSVKKLPIITCFHLKVHCSLAAQRLHVITFPLCRGLSTPYAQEKLPTSFNLTSRLISPDTWPEREFFYFPAFDMLTCTHEALLSSTTHSQSWAEPHIHIHTGKSLPPVPPSHSPTIRVNEEGLGTKAKLFTQGAQEPFTSLINSWKKCVVPFVNCMCVMVCSSDSSDNRYSLFAVVNHSGSLYNGHYTCYIRQQQDQVIVMW